ncbi:MAG: helix-turn-helix domain-containing protein [Candidatus Caldarchaeum sp.]
MRGTEIEALKILTTSSANVERIALQLNISRRQAYRVVNSLMKNGFVEKINDTYAIRRVPLGNALVQVSFHFNISKILQGRAPDILVNLLTPKNLKNF